MNSDLNETQKNISSKKVSKKRVSPVSPSLKFLVAATFISASIAVASNPAVVESFSKSVSGIFPGSFDAATKIATEGLASVGQAVQDLATSSAVSVGHIADAAGVTGGTDGANGASSSSDSASSGSTSAGNANSSCVSQSDIDSLISQKANVGQQLPVLALSITELDARISDTQKRMDQIAAQITSAKAQLIGGDVLSKSNQKIEDIKEQISILKNIQALTSAEQSSEVKIQTEEKTLASLPAKQQSLKKTIDGLLVQADGRKKVEATLEAYIDAKAKSVTFNQQIVDRKKVDDQGLAVYAAKIKMQSVNGSIADAGSSIDSAALSSAYNKAVQSYNTLYNAYIAKYEDTSTYLELASAQGQIKSQLANAEVSYKDASAAYIASYGKDARTLAELTSAIGESQDTYNTQATLLDNLTSTHQSDVATLASQKSTLAETVLVYKAKYSSQGGGVAANVSVLSSSNKLAAGPASTTAGVSLNSSALNDLEKSAQAVASSTAALAKNQQDTKEQVAELTGKLNTQKSVQDSLVAEKSGVQEKMDLIVSQLNAINQTVDADKAKVCAVGAESKQGDLSPKAAVSANTSGASVISAAGALVNDYVSNLFK